MTNKKEQLEEVVETPVEEAVETSTEEVVESPTEEVVEEEPVKEEPTVEEPVVEESVEETIEPVEELDVKDEQLSKEIEKTKEELHVIREVRDELVKLYSDYKQVEQLKNDVVAENESLKKDVEVLSVKLNDYIVAEEKLKAEQKLQKLEQLSAKFTALGQSKTVEYLSSKDEETLSEFEKIVDAALFRVGDTSEMPSVTSNTQAEKLNEKAESDVKVSDPVPAAPKERLSNVNFFENICNELTSQQNGVSGKRVKLM